MASAVATGDDGSLELGKLDQSEPSEIVFDSEYASSFTAEMSRMTSSAVNKMPTFVNCHTIMARAETKVFNFTGFVMNKDSIEYRTVIAVRCILRFITVLLAIIGVSFGRIFTNFHSSAAQWTDYQFAVIFFAVNWVLDCANIGLVVTDCLFCDRKGIATSRNEIIRYHIKQWIFALEIFACLPIDTFVAFDSNLMYILRLFKCLCIPLLIKDLDYIFTVQKWSVYKHPITRTIFVALSSFLFAIICSSSIWFSLVTQHRASFNMNYDWLSDDKIGSAMLTSLYYSVVTMFAVGYGDITPMASAEVALSVAMQITGFTTLATVIGSLVPLFFQTMIAELQFTHRRDLILKYLKNTGIDPIIQEHTLTYFGYSWNRLQGLDDNTIYRKYIPDHLRREVGNFLVGAILREEAFLSQVSESCLRYLYEHLRFEFFMENDLIFSAEQILDRLPVLLSGDVEEFSFDENNKKLLVKAISSGRCFGQFSFLSGEPITNWFESKTNVAELAFIDKTHWNHVLEQYPSAQSSINEYMEKRKQALANGTNMSPTSKKKMQMFANEESGDGEKSIEGMYLPHSRLVTVWNALYFIGLAFYLSINTIFIAFSRTDSKTVSLEQYILLGLLWIVDIFFSVNIFMRLKKFATVRGEHVISDPEQVAKLYKKRDIWFDIVALVPLEAALWFVSPQIMVLGRLNRFLALYRLPKAFNNVLDLFHIRGSKRNIVMTASGMALLLHILACVWYLAGSLSSHSGDQSWIISDPTIGTDSPTAQRYLRSLYFSLLTSFTIGYGGIVPTNIAERVICLCLVVVGTSSYFTIMALITVWAEQANTPSLTFERKFDVLKHVLNELDVSAKVSGDARSFMNQTWTNQSGLKASEVLQMLPRNIQVLIMSNLSLGALENISFFGQLTGSFMDELLLAFEIKDFCADEPMYKGKRIEEFFVVYQGTCILKAKVKSKHIVGETESDSEVSVSTSSRRAVGMRATILNNAIKLHDPIKKNAGQQKRKNSASNASSVMGKLDDDADVYTRELNERDYFGLEAIYAYNVYRRRAQERARSEISIRNEDDDAEKDKAMQQLEQNYNRDTFYQKKLFMSKCCPYSGFYIRAGDSGFATIISIDDSQFEATLDKFPQIKSEIYGTNDNQNATTNEQDENNLSSQEQDESLVNDASVDASVPAEATDTVAAADTTADTAADAPVDTAADTTVDTAVDASADVPTTPSKEKVSSPAKTHVVEVAKDSPQAQTQTLERVQGEVAVESAPPKTPEKEEQSVDDEKRSEEIQFMDCTMSPNEIILSENENLKRMESSSADVEKLGGETDYGRLSTIRKYGSIGFRFSQDRFGKSGVMRNSIFKNGENLTGMLGLIHPLSITKLVWNIVSTVFLLYLAFATPFRIAFIGTLADDHTSAALTDFYTSLPFDIIIDVFFMIDIYLRTSMFTYIEDGFLETNRESIRNRYMRSARFVLDLISSLPWDLVVFFLLLNTGDKTNALQIYLWLRLFRLLRWHNLGGHISEVEQFVEFRRIRIRPAVLRVSFQLASVLIMCHWGGCAFYFIGIQTFDKFDNNWLKSPNAPIFFDDSILAQKSRYIVSAYWSLVTMSSVGFGDIKPSTLPETCVGLVVMIFGVLTYAVTTAFVASFAAHANLAAESFNARQQPVEKFLKSIKMSTKIWDRTHAYFQEIWKKFKGVEPSDAIEPLSVTLQKRVNMDVLLERVTAIDVFKNAPKALLEAIAANMNYEIYVSNETLVRMNVPNNRMFLMWEGMAKGTEGAREGQVFVSGKVWSKRALLEHSWKEPGTIVAQNNVHVYTLTRRAFHEIIATDPTFKAFLYVSGFGIRSNSFVQDGTDKNSKKKSHKKKLNMLSDMGTNGDSVGVDYGNEKWTNILNIATFCAVVFNLWLNAFNFSFLHHNTNAFYTVYAFLLVTDVIFWCNWVYTLGTKPVSKIQELRKTSFVQNIINNFKNDKVAFISHLIILLPFDVALTLLVSPYVGGISRMVRNGLVYQWSTLFSALSNHFQLSNTTALQLVFVAITIIHNICCIWYAVGHSVAFEGDSHAWLTTVSVYEDSTVGKKYLYSFYFVLTVMTTTGYGDITPQNLAEIGTLIAVIFVGNMIYAGVIGTVSAVMGSTHSRILTHFNQLNELQLYTTNKKLPSDLTDRISKHYNDSLQVRSRMDLLRLLPARLHRQCSYEIYGDFLKSIPYFPNFSLSIIERLATAINVSIFSEGDVIFNVGDINDKFHVVIKGSVSIVTYRQNLTINDADNATDADNAIMEADIILPKESEIDNTDDNDEAAVAPTVPTTEENGSVPLQNEMEIEAEVEQQSSQRNGIDWDNLVPYSQKRYRCGHWFGDYSFFMVHPCVVTAVVQTEGCEVVSIDRSKLHSLCEPFFKNKLASLLENIAKTTTNCDSDTEGDTDDDNNDEKKSQPSPDKPQSPKRDGHSATDDHPFVLFLEHMIGLDCPYPMEVDQITSAAQFWGISTEAIQHIIYPLKNPHPRGSETSVITVDFTNALQQMDDNPQKVFRTDSDSSGFLGPLSPLRGRRASVVDGKKRFLTSPKSPSFKKYGGKDESANIPNNNRKISIFNFGRSSKEKNDGALAVAAEESESSATEEMISQHTTSAFDDESSATANNYLRVDTIALATLRKRFSNESNSNSNCVIM